MLVCCRMGLEALVESYAFWRPSLRTLTFEDIPGITKQGTICVYVFEYVCVCGGGGCFPALIYHCTVGF